MSTTTFRNTSIFLLFVSVFLFSSCKKNKMTTLGNSCCECLENNWSKVDNLDKDKKQTIIKNCISEKIENQVNSESKDSSKLLDKLFLLSMKISKELNAKCKVFQENREEIIEILKDGA